MADSKAHKGSATKISDKYLTDFAQHQLESFIEGMTTDPSVLELAEFAAGPGANGASGGDPSGGYNALLTGNPKNSRLPSAAALQNQFMKLASTLNTQVTNLSTNARQMQMDLRQIDRVIGDGEDKANISASAMSTDLGNLNLSGGGAGAAGAGPATTGLPGTGGPATTGPANNGPATTGPAKTGPSGGKAA
jgi:hypothetical protein